MQESKHLQMDNYPLLKQENDKYPYEYHSIHEIPSISQDIEEITREILQILIIEKQKTIKDINKFFQATLQNYFFECYTCGLIAHHYPSRLSKREIKERVEKRLEIYMKLEPEESSRDKPKSQKFPKYILLIQAYGDEIESLNLQFAYTDMLLKIIQEKSTERKFAKKFQTVLHKKLCALFLLQHFLSRKGNESEKYNNFNSLWNGIFLNFKINYFAREKNLVKTKAAEINRHQYTNNSSLFSSQARTAQIKYFFQKQPVTHFNYSQFYGFSDKDSQSSSFTCSHKQQSANKSTSLSYQIIINQNNKQSITCDAYSSSETLEQEIIKHHQHQLNQTPIYQGKIQNQLENQDQQSQKSLTCIQQTVKLHNLPSQSIGSPLEKLKIASFKNISESIKFIEVISSIYEDSESSLILGSMC